MASKNPMKKIIETDDGFDINAEELTDFELAAASGLPDEIIDQYAKEGLLKYREDKDRRRIYDQDSIVVLEEILEMKEQGMTNDEIRDELKDTTF